MECAGQAEKECLALVASHLSKRLMIFISIDLIQHIFQGAREHNTLQLVLDYRGLKKSKCIEVSFEEPFRNDGAGVIIVYCEATSVTLA